MTGGYLLYYRQGDALILMLLMFLLYKIDLDPNNTDITDTLTVVRL